MLNWTLILFVSGPQETFQWMFTHIAVVRDLVAMQYKEHQEVRYLFCVCVEEEGA